MTAQQADKTVREELRHTRDELWRLADEIRVKIHLAGMEVKDTWDRLEPKLQEFEDRMEDATEKIGAELKDASSDLKARMQKLRDEIKG